MSDDAMVFEVASSQVKSQWHDYLDRVSRERRVIVVTRYGRPIAKLVPYELEAAKGVFGALSGTAQVPGNIVEPIGEPWEADG